MTDKSVDDSTSAIELKNSLMNKLVIEFARFTCPPQEERE